MTGHEAEQTAEILCGERIGITGRADFGFGVAPGCDNCTGLLEFAPSTAVDLTNPSLSPGACNPLLLDYTGQSMGMAMLSVFGSTPGHWETASGPRSWGDFLTIATMDENTQSVLGFDGSPLPATDLSAPGNSDWALNTHGLDYTHAGFVDGSPGSSTLASESNIAGFANRAGSGSAAASTSLSRETRP